MLSALALVLYIWGGGAIFPCYLGSGFHLEEVGVNDFVETLYPHSFHFSRGGGKGYCEKCLPSPLLGKGGSTKSDDWCLGRIRETKDIRRWLGSHTMVVVMVVSLAPTPGRGHAHLLPTTSTMLAPRRARFLLKKVTWPLHWL